MASSLCFKRPSFVAIALSILLSVSHSSSFTLFLSVLVLLFFLFFIILSKSANEKENENENNAIQEEQEHEEHKEEEEEEEEDGRRGQEKVGEMISDDDEESLIEITLPDGHYKAKQEKELNVEQMSEGLLIELLSDHIIEEDNLIEIDINMGSIKCSTRPLEIKA
ncbi:hypothetical protein IHE45_13G013100 [Dioscorea alata]|uniref:Uncharacterized protein n=1 Tax=Dioscorea alata TaxID=55571 RepID=A0ACB7UWD6_DIOAL|nr:hypothetical protein IHE45_13G013100 [Dioscorea alata]